MRKSILLSILVISLFSCKKESQEPFGKQEEKAVVSTPESLGATIFEGKGNCVACHQVDQKVIGPSLKEIAKIYKGKNGNMVGFLKGEDEAIVDPEQYEVMKPNLEITKTFTDEELKAVEAYIYSNLKEF
jgi:cytochrome c